jgi:hypothetical protein
VHHRAGDGGAREHDRRRRGRRRQRARRRYAEGDGAGGAIVDWGGIGDAAGAPIPPSPERIDALLDLYPAFRAFEMAYFLPALVLDAEKNACAPAPNGTSAAAPSTAAAA